MACRDCEEKAAATDLDERVSVLEKNDMTTAIFITVLAAAVYVLWSKVFKEA